MKRSRAQRALVMAATLIIMSAAPAQAQQLNNGDFERGDWTGWPGHWGFATQVSAASASGGAFGASLELNPAIGSQQGGLYQNVPGAAALPEGTRLKLEGDFAVMPGAPFIGGNRLVLQVEFFNMSGGAIGSHAVQVLNASTVEAPGTFRRDFLAADIPPNVGIVRYTILINGFITGGGGAYVDNLTISAVAPSCGDRILDPTLGEVCDSGPDRSDTIVGACKLDCSGYVQPAVPDMGPDLPPDMDMPPDMPPVADMAPDLPAEVDMLPDMALVEDMPPSIDMALTVDMATPNSAPTLKLTSGPEDGDTTGSIPSFRVEARGERAGEALTVLLMEGDTVLASRTGAASDTLTWSARLAPIRPLSDGAHTLRLLARDGDGLESEVITRTITTKTAEVVDLSTTGAKAADETPVLTGQAPPGSRVVITIDDLEPAEVFTDDAGRWYYAPDPLPPGPHTVRVDVYPPDGEQTTETYAVRVGATSVEDTSSCACATPDGQPATPAPALALLVLGGLASTRRRRSTS